MNTHLDFGSELRRLRQDAGLSLTEFAAMVNYSKSHLSKIERSMKRTPPALARRCDALLGAEGRLQRLVDSDAVAEDGERDRGAVGRRKVVTVGATSLISFSLGANQQVVRSEKPAPSTDLLRVQFDHLRLLGQSTDPVVLLPVLRSQTRLVVDLAGAAGPGTRERLLALGARFAEYTGWIAQEAGDNLAALNWTADAVQLAEAGGDPHLASYALVRRALVTFYDSNAGQTVGLAVQAQRDSLPPRIRGLAAQREAQGHALAGDERACLSCLDRARELLDCDDALSGAEPPIGTTSLADPAAMVTGWCLYDLGRPQEAAEVLDREYLRIAPQALRARTRYGLRRALAHAAAGEIEYSCEIAGELLGILSIVDSATVRSDVSRLARELSRFRANKAVRDLQPVLARALRPVQL
ncbi:multiprotein-bridging factor 1 family protein [Streptomyces sp. NPDC088725]|uniref:helix-turn-helix domain-containing protein n=1 Tax=Streptomyces sp. NPDC088725 TaxID=3365873 RepID=UPI0037FD17E1